MIGEGGHRRTTKHQKTTTNKKQQHTPTAEPDMSRQPSANIPLHLRASSKQLCFMKTKQNERLRTRTRRKKCKSCSHGRRQTPSVRQTPSIFTRLCIRIHPSPCIHPTDLAATADSCRTESNQDKTRQDTTRLASLFRRSCPEIYSFRAHNKSEEDEHSALPSS